MSEPQIIVIKDHNRDNDEDPITVYIDGKKAPAKVLGWWSDDEWPSLLEKHVYVTCYGDEGCADDWHITLPDQWTDEEWAALVATEGWMVP